MNDIETTQTTQTTQSAQGPLRPASVWPTLQAHDAPALIDFLVGTVGFLRTAVYEDGDLIAHAQLDWPEGGGIMLGSYRGDTTAWCLEPGTLGAYVVTDRVDELYERLSAAGVRILREIEDQPYGSREFAIADPEGNKWSFGTYRGEPRVPPA
ncbi:VOC family protein [Streptomyces sp. TS71-3]|uniref:VOC family protein n=1 Tax=Streptomyces sp. TS71-3 TaxID=2733862 RepID=UPI001B241C7A|nr:VOC family protein [Streptomyces sp. TS71-3]GHJ42473.1 similarity with Glyoxalase/Bleomycin resistance protein [Streptomyces sp. TS71-3]